jgi:Sec-independent protein translocase protein TatA
MEILGIGPLELFFIVLIALIVLGPRDMIKAGRTIGRFLRSIVTSPNWRTFQQASKDIRTLPNRLMREAGLEDIQKELPNPKNIEKEAGLKGLEDDIQDFQHSISDWTTPPKSPTAPKPVHPPEPQENTISNEEPGDQPVDEENTEVT